MEGGHRPVDWLVGALAHEAFHVLHTDATEASATDVGEACRRRAKAGDGA